jgi:hypothetical protein
MNLEITWSEFKSQVNTKSLKVQYVTSNDNYHVVAFDSLFKLYCILPIGVDNSDTIDFETNYKPTANSKIEDIDSQGRQISRIAAGQAGWVYLCHPIEFETSKIDSLYEKLVSGTNRGSSSVKFYDANDAEVTDAQNEANIVKTVLLIKPSYDYELISGDIQQIESPSTDMRVWVNGGIIELGGAYIKEFAGGVNMRFFGAQESLKTDGRAAKYMKKDIVGVPYQANQLQVIIKHNAGVQHKFMLLLEYFRA